MCFLCSVEQPYFHWQFGHVKFILDFYIPACRAKKNFSTIQGFAKKASKKEPRVFLHQLVFSVKYFCNDLPKGQDNRLLGIFTPSGFQCMV